MQDIRFPDSQLVARWIASCLAMTNGEGECAALQDFCMSGGGPEVKRDTYAAPRGSHKKTRPWACFLISEPALIQTARRNQKKWRE